MRTIRKDTSTEVVYNLIKNNPGKYNRRDIAEMIGESLASVSCIFRTLKGHGQSIQEKLFIDGPDLEVDPHGINELYEVMTASDDWFTAEELCIYAELTNVKHSLRSCAEKFACNLEVRDVPGRKYNKKEYRLKKRDISPSERAAMIFKYTSRETPYYVSRLLKMPVEDVAMIKAIVVNSKM